MAGGETPCGSKREHRDSGRGERSSIQSQLLRYSHIFSSAVREILEVKFLKEASAHPLTVLQLRLLKLIGLSGARQVGELAVCLGVSAPAATKNINKLERLGLIVRSTSQGDRRATLLSPSAKGRRLLKKYEGLKSTRLGPVLEEFSGDELNRFGHFLERFSLRLIEREDSDAALCLRCAGYCVEDCSIGLLRGGCPYKGARGLQVSKGSRAGA